jgi:hypothetical protein
MGILFCNQFIILCCSNRRAIIKGSVGNGFPLAIAKAYSGTVVSVLSQEDNIDQFTNS